MPGAVGDRLGCPACGTTNIAGTDVCENCHADLRRLGLPATMQGAGESEFANPLTEIRLGRPNVLPASATVAAAVALLRDDPAAAVVVRRGPVIAGIFTERDVLSKVAGKPEQLQRRLDELMTRDPVILRDTDTIAIALNKMVVGGFRHIPLVHGDDLVGVVTASDLMQWIMQKYLD